MDAIHYLRGRMELWLTSAGTTDPIEFAFSRHELRGAAMALQEAGLLTAEDTHTLLDEYDARLVAFHYRSDRVPSRHHGRGGPRWEALDDRDNVYTPRGSGAFSSRAGTRGVVEFAGRLPTKATRFVVRATNAIGETKSVVIDLCPCLDVAGQGGRPATVHGRRTRPSEAKQTYSQRQCWLPIETLMRCLVWVWRRPL